MAVCIIMLGPPGSGKGTQAQEICRKYGVGSLATGDTFRGIVKGTLADEERAILDRIGIHVDEIQAIMQRGGLVPDATTIQIVRAFLKGPGYKNGIVLDGFPRTRAQAEALDEMLLEVFGAGIDAVVFLDVSEEEVVRRIAGRLICSVDDRHVYNIHSKPPKTPDVCDIDGAPLIRRADEDSVRARYAAYWDYTAPLVDFYEGRGLLARIDGDQAIDRVTQDVLEAIRRKVG
jgi:adenylate kinase